MKFRQMQTGRVKISTFEYRYMPFQTFTDFTCMGIYVVCQTITIKVNQATIISLLAARMVYVCKLKLRILIMHFLLAIE